MSNVVENIAVLNSRIKAAALRAGRTPESVTLIAVTKTVPPEVVEEAVAAGVVHLGENRVQEARDKKPLLPGETVWHLIGSLQTNKAKYAARLFDWVHSLDRLELAEELHRRASAEGIRLPVLVEVNVAGEASKHGLTFDEVPAFVRQVARLDSLSVRGLMTVAPFADEPEEVRPVFRRLSRLADELRQEGIQGVDIEHLSMGMSQDFEVAVEEGATMVRIGTALFGRRQR